MLEMLPLCDEDRKELTDWLMQNDIVRGNLSALYSMMDLPKLRAMREHYTFQKRTFEDWKNKFINEKKEEIMSRKEVMERLKRGKIKFNPTAKTEELMRMLVSPKRATMEIPPPQPSSHVPHTSLKVVSEPEAPPIECPHCGSASKIHKVTNTYPNGNRRRICCSCALPFIGRRKEA